MTKVKTPEPVAEICSDYDLHWAGSGAISPLCERTGAKVGSLLITATQAEAYADARVREALEEAAMIPRAYAESLDRQGWGNRFPDELTAIFNASTNMADRIRALIPPLSGPVEPTT